MFELANSKPRDPIVRLICFASEFNTLPLIIESHYVVIDQKTGFMANWRWVGEYNSDTAENAYKADEQVPFTPERLRNLLEESDLTAFLCSKGHPWRRKVIDVLDTHYRKNYECKLLIATHWETEQEDQVETNIASEYEHLFCDGYLECNSREEAVIAVRGVAELIMVPSMIGMNFTDVRVVLENQGALQTTRGYSSGDGRAIRAIENALSHVSATPQSMLVTINAGLDIELDEFSIISQAVDDFMTSEGAIVAVGVVYQLELKNENRLEVSLITGSSNSKPLM